MAAGLCWYSPWLNSRASPVLYQWSGWRSGVHPQPVCWWFWTVRCCWLPDGARGLAEGSKWIRVLSDYQQHEVQQCAGSCVRNEVMLVTGTDWKTKWEQGRTAQQKGIWGGGDSRLEMSQHLDNALNNMPEVWLALKFSGSWTRWSLKVHSNWTILFYFWYPSEIIIPVCISTLDNSIARTNYKDKDSSSKVSLRMWLRFRKSWRCLPKFMQNCYGLNITFAELRSMWWNNLKILLGKKTSETEGLGLVELVAQKPAEEDNMNSFNSGLDNLLGNGSIMDSKRKGVNVLCTHVGGVQWTTEKNQAFCLYNISFTGNYILRLRWTTSLNQMNISHILSLSGEYFNWFLSISGKKKYLKKKAFYE